MFVRFLTVACIALVLTSACTPREQSPSEQSPIEQSPSIERDSVDDMIVAIVTQLEEDGLYRPQSVSEDQHVRNELAKRWRAHTGKSAEDKRIFQLEQLSEHAPEIHEVLHLAGFE